MYLSYSGRKKFTTCAFSYWNGYINHTTSPKPDDRLGSIYGSSVGKLFEDFYNLELYRSAQPQGELLGRVEETVRKILHQETTDSGKWRKGGVLLWKGPKREGKNPKALYANEEELIEDVRQAVVRGCRIIRHYRLLGKGAKAEVLLDSVIEGDTLGGRADFIMRRVRPHDDEVILDGKGSRWREDYVDVAQLKWYAMLFRLKNKRLPDRMGFVFWRFEPPESMDWVEVTDAEIDAFQVKVLADVHRIKELSAGLTTPAPFEAARKMFLPIAAQPEVDRTEVEQACRFCPYATDEICPDGARVVEETTHRRNPV